MADKLNPDLEALEIFKPIRDYKNLYEVSNLGRVRSLGNGKTCSIPGRILKFGNDTENYVHVDLFKKGKRKLFDVHRLVATTFTSNPERLPYVHHINGIRSDNRVENLEWSDNRANQNYRYKKEKTSSRYPGVCWHRVKRRWISRISLNRKLIHLGYFTKEDEAAKAYEEALLRLKEKA